MKLTKLLKEAFSAGDNEITDDKVLMNLENWDSMAYMQFIGMLEETYGFELTGEEIAEMLTIGDIKKIIKLKGAEI